MIKRISTALVKRYLAKYDARDHVSRETIPFKEAKRIGVVYRADNERDKRIMEILTKEFESVGKKVLTLGFIDEKEVGTMYNPNMHHDFFARKDLTRLRLPKKTRVMRFITEPFDYLIYGSDEVSLPLLGISALSRASCRVGPYFEEFEFGFDLLIKGDMVENNYAKSVVQYISKIGNG